MQPEKINKLQRSDKGFKKVNIIHTQVSNYFKNTQKNSIPFYKLVIDPHNFMNTVENAFQLSFLARDGIIAIEKGCDNLPVVRVAQPGERKGSEPGQSLCKLTVQICKVSLYSF